MKHIANQKGIALITSLLLSLISLAMVLAVIYFVTQGARITGIEKKYQTALEAAHGASEFVTKTVIPNAITLTVSELANPAKDYSIATLESSFSAINLNVNDSLSPACLHDKLHKYTKFTRTDLQWGSTCDSSLTVGPSSYDMKFTLSAVAPEPDFDVYVKIVDTVRGNSNTSGLDLEGLGVVESGSGLVVPMHRPYLYRLEVQAQRQNKDEQANLTVLYGF